MRSVLALAIALCPRVAAGQDTASTVRALGETLKREYIDVDVAARADAALQRGLADGRYAAAATPETLVPLLNRDLRDVTHDKHIWVEVVPPAAQAVQPTPPSSSADAKATRAEAVRRSNAGVRHVEILRGNVGYLDLSNFFRPEEARDTIATAMRLLSKADALIIDMRRNGGGSPGTVVFLLGYLIDAPGATLFEIVHRPPEPPDRYALDATLPAERDGKRPIAVLTSAQTFSGGEGLAFLLQERHRAEIVGEVTAGAANPGTTYPVNDRFRVNVPNGRIKSAIGGGNWEGTGVTPDVKVPAADALQTAHDRLLRTLGR
ncbi:MAG TPA: S41 family peptidase [Vicinamibacterales bacterium]|jgi:C-terminal processing protease CtpA/Prc|nr:S41 family peptidase [Vicinamibacterales bacterium]